MTPPDLAHIRDRILAHRPTVARTHHQWRAATALILHEHPQRGPEILFIERTHRPGDQWSGHMALPGGRREPQDPDLAATAARETHEEVGLELDPPIGRLDDTGGVAAPVAVATFAYEVTQRPPLSPDPAEVSDTVWIPLAHLLDPDNTIRFRHRGIDGFAGVRYRHHVVWGLTLMTLEQFVRILDLRLPAAPRPH